MTYIIDHLTLYISNVKFSEDSYAEITMIWIPKNITLARGYPLTLA